jgi:hypothetical protein
MAPLRDYHAAIDEIIIKYNGTLERYAVEQHMSINGKFLRMTPPPGLRDVLGNSLGLVRTVGRRSLVPPPLRDRDGHTQMAGQDRILG